MKPILFVLTAVWSAVSMAQSNCACHENTLWDPYESDPIPKRETVSYINAQESPTVMLLSMLGAHNRVPVEVRPDRADTTMLEFGAFHPEYFDRMGTHVWLDADGVYERISQFDTPVVIYDNPSTRLDFCLDFRTGERLYVERCWSGFPVGPMWWYDDSGSVCRLIEVNPRGEVTHETHTDYWTGGWWGPSEREIQLGFRYADSPFAEMKYASWWPR